MKKYMSGGDVKQVKQIAKKEVKTHEKTMHKMAGGGKMPAMKKGGYMKGGSC